MSSSYLHLYERGILQDRIDQASLLLDDCTLCSRQCHVNRKKRETGYCGIGKDTLIASYNPHFGEEDPLIGTGGSGTIFFCGCNLRCLFCQNYGISHYPENEGTVIDNDQLAAIMVDLQARGCHNINFVTPSHIIPQILAALPIAIESGLTIPLVYNSSGYDSVHSLQLLENVIDIYMPDFKFWENDSGKRYANASDYPQIAKLAIKEMHRQVGDLQINSEGIATRGVLLRHLIMPDGLSETKEILNFISKEISQYSYVNVMDQYHPCGKAINTPPIDRTLFGKEFRQAIQLAKLAGLTRLDRRDIISLLKRF